MSNSKRLSAFWFSVSAVSMGAVTLPALTPYSAQASSAPASMLVYGDSIAAAMLADTQAGLPLTSDQTNRLLAAMSLQQEHKPGTPEFTQGLQLLGAAPNLSAYTGRMPWSHARRIEAKTGRPLKTWNVAVNGTTTESLYGQIERVRALYAEGRKPADYVVINVGSNDYCQRVSPQTFRANFQFRLYQILKDHPQSTVLVIPIPDVPQVLTVPEQMAFEIMGRRVSCHNVVTTAQLCPQRRLSPGQNDTGLYIAKQDRETLNAIILDEVDRQARGRGSFAPYAGRLAVARDVAREGILSSALLAADCFHPSTKGQEILANATWQAAEKLLFGGGLDSKPASLNNLPVN